LQYNDPTTFAVSWSDQFCARRRWHDPNGFPTLVSHRLDRHIVRLQSICGIECERLSYGRVGRQQTEDQNTSCSSKMKLADHVGHDTYCWTLSRGCRQLAKHSLEILVSSSRKPHESVVKTPHIRLGLLLSSLRQPHLPHQLSKPWVGAYGVQ
jgi:hypothetical protein